MKDENKIISISGTGERCEYELSSEDAAFVGEFLDKLAKKNR